MRNDFFLKIDHFGMIVKDIKEAARFYQDLFNLQKITEVIEDSIQKVYVQFFTTNDGNKIELIQPTDKNSPSYNALLKGGGANHICFETNNIEKEIVKLKKANCIIVCPPTKSAGLKNGVIAFAVHPFLGLVELVEYHNED